MSEENETETSTPEPKPPEPHGPRLGTVILWTIIVGLLVALAWLLSEINSRKFFIESEKGYLVVKKGNFLPMGRDNWTPEDPELRTVYAPIKLPAGQSIPAREFADRAEMDREIWSILMRLSQDRIYSEDAGEFSLGAAYMERLAKLKASSDELKKLGSLRGDLSYREAKRILDDATSQLKNALKKFAEADSQGAAKFTDGAKYTRMIGDVLKLIEGKAAVYTTEEIETMKKQAVADFKAAAAAMPPDAGTAPPGPVPGQAAQTPPAAGQSPAPAPAPASPAPPAPAPQKK
ncbi:MAG: hypothetical protein HY897_07830 [Deltaproteobacteria bacterium]|nr:hypothetical protein [Deltaproteobacteria bacterium]